MLNLFKMQNSNEQAGGHSVQQKNYNRDTVINTVITSALVFTVIMIVEVIIVCIAAPKFKGFTLSACLIVKVSLEIISTWSSIWWLLTV